jgi:hypothetical protein
VKSTLARLTNIFWGLFLPCQVRASKLVEHQAWYAEFLLEIDLKILLRKTGARLNLKISLISLHIDPRLVCLVIT